jgi:hypothetical protein
MSEWARATFESIKAMTDPLRERLSALEATVRALGPAQKGDPGEPGGIGPAGLQGPQGPPGRDAEPVSADVIAKAVAEYLAAHPPAAGRDGKDGERGADGTNGIDGAVGPMGPQGAKGLDGIGRDGIDGKDGRDGLTGRDGKDGAPGEKGLDGKDGLDGFGFDDLEAEFDGERTVTFKYVKGERVKAFQFRFNVPIFRDVYREGTAYEQGDLVQFGGNVYMAKQDTTQKPFDLGVGEKHWLLMVRRGRDGKGGK